jgi:hypothetical protein
MEAILGTSGDDLITKLTSYLVSDNPTTPDVPSTVPSKEGREEFDSAFTNPIVDGIDVDESHAKGDATSQGLATTPRCSLERPVSDLTVWSGTKRAPKTMITLLNTFQSKDDTCYPKHASFLSPVSLPSTHTITRRPVRSPPTESEIIHEAVMRRPASSQKLPVEQTKPISKYPPRPGQPRRRLTIDEAVTKTRPVLAKSAAVRSNSDPELAKAFANSKSRDRDLPLKSCIKREAKTDTITPPDALQQGIIEEEVKASRRTKAVDFKGSHSKPAPLGSRAAIVPENSMNIRIHHGRPAKKWRRTPSNLFPSSNTISTTKSNVADPAVTRTDVHVVAVTPSRNAHNITNEDPDPATPTMQIIETKSGSYEVIWDNVLPEQKISVRGRRSSSASHCLKTVSPGARRGLERVNSKLAGWFGTWNSLSNSFKPTIVVFPDDDGRATRFDSVAEDKEDVPLLAPPNSQVTSATSSCHPSRPASAPLTRTVSNEDVSIGVTIHGTSLHVAQNSLQPSEQPLRMPNSGFLRRGRRNKYPAKARHLSSLEEADAKFCGHRDSVSVAHARLVRPERVSAELLERQDSYKLAKKRKHTQNRATSAEGASPQRKDLSLEVLNLAVDNDIPEVSLHMVKKHAAEALKNSSPPPILGSLQHASGQRHIQIVE